MQSSTTSTAAASHSSTVRTLLEPLIDLVHGDVVLHDACSRAVASALVRTHDDALRLLVAADILPSGVQRAVEAYCVRDYLMHAPDLLRTSADVVAALRRLATTLEQTAAAGPGADASAVTAAAEIGPANPEALLRFAGRRMMESMTALQQCNSTRDGDNQNYTCLIDALGDAVVGYIALGARQCVQDAAEDLSCVTSAPYHVSLQQFVVSAIAQRESRARAEEAEVQTLLFGEATTRAAPAAPSAPAPASAQQRPLQLDTTSQPGHEPLLKHPIPARARSGRRLLHSQRDSTEEKLAALEQGYLAVTPSPIIIVDPATLLVEMSAVTSSPSPAVDVSDLVSFTTSPQRKAPRSEPLLIGASETSILRAMEWADSSTESAAPTPQPSASDEATKATEGVRQCVRRPEAVSRSYRLSAATNRFEPSVAKGFH